MLRGGHGKGKKKCRSFALDPVLKVAEIEEFVAPTPRAPPARVCLCPAMSYLFCISTVASLTTIAISLTVERSPLGQTRPILARLSA